MRLTSSTHRQVSSEMSSMPLRRPPRHCCRPRGRSRTPRMTPRPRARRSKDRSRRSLRRARPVQGPANSSTATASAFVSMSASITFIPASAKARPSANPMPLAPPVTNAVLPTRSRMAPFMNFPTRIAMSSQTLASESLSRPLVFWPTIAGADVLILATPQEQAPLEDVDGRDKPWDKPGHDGAQQGPPAAGGTRNDELQLHFPSTARKVRAVAEALSACACRSTARSPRRPRRNRR